MKKEIIEFVKENKLNPFNNVKTQINTKEESFYKTKDAKTIHNKLLSKLSSKFIFSDTSNIFNFFEFLNDKSKIIQRQEFFSSLKYNENSFLESLKKPKNWWNPDYGIVVVTEDEKTYTDLQKLGCPVKFLLTESDLESLSDYDLVQVLECENFSRALESLPQSVFFDSIDDVYLERYVSLLSGWSENIRIVDENINEDEINEILNNLKPLLEILNQNKKEKIKKENVESVLIEINNRISNEMKTLTVSGESLFKMMSRNSLPDEINSVIIKSIKESGMDQNIFTRTLPVEIDEGELENLIRKQDSEEHTSVAEKIKKNANGLRKVAVLLSKLESLLIYYDFCSGISKYIENDKKFAVISSEMSLKEGVNMFIDNPKPISFHLNNEERCSILTGANSGGKTTLLEHIIQLYSLFQIGLPIRGEIKMPIFNEIYYFAKNKGSANKGAFETLLTQMSKINPTNKTLILADEIESVTEPGVAGSIISASADFFISRGCFMIIATHLGKEIQKNLPKFARIDGIEAKGLTENIELIVDHNPVIGRLANSTPELIIEKMANVHKTDYYNYLFSFIKKQK